MHGKIVAARRARTQEALTLKKRASHRVAPTILFLSMLLLFAASPPQRIISVAPSFTEILYGLGIDQQIIGTTNYCNYPAAATKTAKIGDVLNPNIEKIISLKPDLVLCGAWKWRLPERLRSVGINVVEIPDADNLAGIFDRVRLIGRNVRREKEAELVIARLQAKLNAIRSRSQQYSSARKVFIELDAGNWTVGGGSYLNEVMQMLGLKNIFAERTEPYFMATMESIAHRNPDIIISLNRKSEAYLRAPEWQTVTAVRRRAIIDKDDVDWDAITRQGPRMADGIEILEKLVNSYR